jgi:quinol-cytochrome oxidoreductase complex cytochrome b subunit
MRRVEDTPEHGDVRALETNQWSKVVALILMVGMGLLSVLLASTQTGFARVVLLLCAAFSLVMFFLTCWELLARRVPLVLDDDGLSAVHG